MFFMCFCSDVDVDCKCGMTTANTPIFGVQVAEWDTPFGFTIKLVDEKSSSNCTVLERIFPMFVFYFAVIHLS